jgi:Protein of unknown function (DUF2510)
MSETSGTSAARGWYPDTNPDYERWWDGTAWTGATHLSAALSGFGNPVSRRKLWPGVNTAARIARVLGFIAFGMPFLGGFILIGGMFAPHALLPTILVYTGVDAVVAIVALVFAIVGLSRSALLGASGVSGLMILYSAIALFLDGFLVVLAAMIGSVAFGS